MAKKRSAAVGIADVAKQAGVSRVAVSHVLHGRGMTTVRVSQTTRERILKAAKELNYRPNRAAQQLRGIPSDIVGVIVDTWDARVVADRLAAVEEEAASQGLRLMIGQAHGDDQRLAEYLADFEERRVRGVLCLLDLVSTRHKNLRSLLKEGQRIVFHGRRPGTIGGCVQVDVASGVRQALAHLRQRGRQRPCMVLTDTRDYRTGIREKTFARESASWGLTPEQHLWVNRGEPIAPTVEILDQIIDAMVVERAADALVTADDMWGVRLVQRLKQRGLRVPEDVAVTGHDNLDLATVIDPPLTTIDQNHPTYARAAIELLLAMPEEGNLPPNRHRVVVQPRLVVRNST